MELCFIVPVAAVFLFIAFWFFAAWSDNQSAKVDDAPATNVLLALLWPLLVVRWVFAYLFDQGKL